MYLQCIRKLTNKKNKFDSKAKGTHLQTMKCDVFKTSPSEHFFERMTRYSGSYSTDKCTQSDKITYTYNFTSPSCAPYTIKACNAC